MSSSQLLPLTGQAFDLEMSFSAGETTSFSLLLVSPRQCSAWLFPQGLLSCSTPTWAFSVTCSAPPSPQKGNIPSVYLATSFVQRGCNGSPAVLEYVLPSKQCVALTWQFSRFTWLKRDQLQSSTGRQQREVLCLLVFGRLWSSQMLAAALFLWFSALHYYLRGCRHTKAE
jgi:hypothetical protein